MHSPEWQELPGTTLLRLARQSIEHGVTHGKPLPVDCTSLPPALSETAATFTTLDLDGKLRGCCGTLEPEYPLGRDVARSAFQAAFRDPRFDPVTRDEVVAIRLEVCVLSPLETLSVSDEADLIDQLSPGTDGLVIVSGARRATFLPKVWEKLPDPTAFLAELRTKCGLSADYWSESLGFLRYRTTTFAE